MHSIRMPYSPFFIAPLNRDGAEGRDQRHRRVQSRFQQKVQGRSFRLGGVNFNMAIRTLSAAAGVSPAARAVALVATPAMAQDATPAQDQAQATDAAPEAQEQAIVV